MGEVPTPAVDQIHKSLQASRRESARLLAEAERRAGALRERVSEEDRRRASRRISEMSELGSQISESSERVQTGYVRIVEAMAVAAGQLVDAARRADFSAPPWPGGIQRVVEVKFSETREVSFRFESHAALRTPSPEPPTMPRSHREEQT